jgi:hypothetical protein
MGQEIRSGVVGTVVVSMVVCGMCGVPYLHITTTVLLIEEVEVGMTWLQAPMQA